MSTAVPGDQDPDPHAVGSDADEPAPDLEAGFTSVDAQPDPSFLIAGMDQTAAWTAVRRLRAFEAGHLDLQEGHQLLDVGCGVGDASLALAAELQPGGRVVGIDATAAMVDEANRRAVAAGADAFYRTGDAMALGEADNSFDACRSERMLQWVPEPAVAIEEMVRILKPGGRLSLIDTDWRTFVCDIPDTSGFAAVTDALYEQRGEPSFVGRRLLNVCRDLGLRDLQVDTAAHAWTAWNPDEEPAPSGFFPIDVMLNQLTDLGLLDRAVADTVIEQTTDAGRRDRFFMSVTMFAVAARKA